MKHLFSLNIILFFLSLQLISGLCYAQTVQIGSIQDRQMRIQMLSSDSLSISTTIGPYQYKDYLSVIKQADPLAAPFQRPLKHTTYHLPGEVTFGILPFTFRNTINSRFPHSENNQAAWYGRGVNSEINAGGYLSHQFFTLSFQPHLIYQQNKDFQIPNFVTRRDGSVAFRPDVSSLFMDYPFRMGPESFYTFDWGNSSIRIHNKYIETGVSSEPLWWGPANHYPLVMSTNAPGIHHFFLGSRRPLTVPYLGNFSFQWIMGSPKQTEWFDGVGADQNRFLNAANIAYQLPFYPNLTLGITRVYQLFVNERISLSDITLIMGPLQKVNLISQEGEDEERQVRNQILSTYFHMRLPEARAEIYGEFFRDDHSYDIRDFINQPHHNSAYSFGFRKLFDGPFADFFSMNLEFTNLTASQLNQVRPQTYFYSHRLIQQGHTNRGQILGAAIGPGSNSQLIAVDVFKDQLNLGLLVQRVVVNDNFHFEKGSSKLLPGSSFGDYFRHRVNLNLGTHLLYISEPFYLQGKLLWTKAYNYGRYDYGRLHGINVTNYDRNDRSNIHFQISINYVF